MSDRPDSTVMKRPLPRRPPNGLLAWQATVGYICTQYSPDAMLKLQVYPLAGETRWGASVSWGQHEEQVRDALSLASALDRLWQEVARHHVIFASEEEAVKMPTNYADNQWVDPHTHDTLNRLIRVTQAVFKDDWLLIVVYQPVELSSTRVQARLLARNNSVRVGGRGPSVRDACHDLYANAARVYASAASKREDKE